MNGIIKMDKIRILQFPIANTKGGTTEYVLNNWKYIDKSKFQFDFATISKTLDFEDELKEQGCKVYYISCYAEENKAKFIEEMNIILDQGYDVIHLHTNCWKSFLVEELAKKKGIPKIIVHSHNTMVLEEDEEGRKKALVLHELKKSQLSEDLATDFWACSKMAAEWLFGNRIPEEKVVIMKNAIDVEKFQFDNNIRLKYRKELGLENSFVIGNVGRFVYQKNHEFLINVFIKLKKQKNNVKLLLIGIGPLEGKVLNKVNENNLNDDVIFLNKRVDINKLMQAMDIFCLPSRFEGLPITLIEAQAAGLKCITSENVSQGVEITDDIVRIPLDEEIWIEKIVKIAEGYARCNNNGIISKAGYSIQNQIKLLENLYCR